MSRKIPHERRYERHLTKCEMKLWNKISEHIKPLSADDRLYSSILLNNVSTRNNPSFRYGNINQSCESELAWVNKKVDVKSSSHIQLAEFDEKLATKVRRGRIKIDAKLDLHGMRQPEAKTTLEKFLFSSLSKGHRIVLVITGKGIPIDKDRPWNGEPQINRGILKRMLPHWLNEKRITAAVISYTTAYIQHGGEGAFYIHLRARRRI
ncbi:MAG: hypothetical protein TECD_01224 [Hyphomicrobiaceae bacterium hypho_1]